VYGTPFFDYLSNHPDDARIFNQSMSAGTSMRVAPLVEAYDFSRFRSIVDVGGGQGVLLAAILAANPNLRGVLQDSPSVVAGAEALRTERVASRVEIVGGDFFDRVPEGADAYVLKGVIHDWGDEDALKILRNCRRAISPEGRLLVIERILQPPNQPDPGRFMDLMMLVMVKGRERGESDFRTLLGDAGFSLDRVIPTAGPAIIESRPI
jgi:SAM-dependent methyltransferase